MKKGQKLLPNDVYPAPKEFHMWAVFRSPTSRYPEIIFNRAGDAKSLVLEWKREGYDWAKNSFYRRIVIKMKDTTIYDCYKHERKMI